MSPLPKQPGSKSFQKAKIARGSKPTIEQKPRVLILCEGEKTESFYFNGFISMLKKQNPRKMIFEIKGKGYEPKKLLEIASYEKDEADEDDQIWIIFDRDEHKHFNTAINNARDKGISVAYSNPSFELWYLIHYQDQTAYIERDDAKKELKKFLPEYEKNDMKMYSTLKSLRKQAERRAINLRKKHKEDGNTKPEDCNPSTTVDLMLKKIEDAYKKATP